MTSSDRHGELDRAFGRDGISGLVTPDRAMRAREVSRPTPADVERGLSAANRAIAGLTPRRK